MISQGKRRSPGRPKENKAIRELKVKAWFNAVAEASGKTAYELEKEFAPSYVDRTKFTKQRSRLWEKYRLGKTMPTVKEKKRGRRPIAILVEEKYPGTLKWLVHPVWSILDMEADIGMTEIKHAYQQLGPEVGQLILESDDRKIRTGFWKKSYTDINEVIASLHSTGTESAYMALIVMLRESLICQRDVDYQLLSQSLKDFEVHASTKWLKVPSEVLQTLFAT